MNKPSKPKTKLQIPNADIKAQYAKLEKRVLALEKQVAAIPRVIIGKKGGPPGPDTLQ